MSATAVDKPKRVPKREKEGPKCNVGSDRFTGENRRETKRSVITQEIAELERQRRAAGAIAEEWNDYVHTNYNGHGTKAIMNMRAYHENIANGFGHCNSEGNYQMHLRKDPDGSWLKEALHGAELYLAAYQFTKLICAKKKSMHS